MFIYVVVVLLILLLFLFVIIFLLNKGIIVIRLKLINLNFFRDLELVLNIWRFMFLIIVLLITIRVLFFSFSYIRVYSVQNFMLLYLLFVLRIFWLILNNNFYWIIFGWDGLGVVSFLLIIFYINYERVTNGLFTIFQNRLGDLFFVIFLLLIFTSSLNSNVVLKFGIMFLIIGACVKRAQFPFNAWLLAAISAPTPISSLVHSSTLVVAGVYILLQYSYCLTDRLIILKYLSMLTLIISLFGLLNESDIKKLIAYSTISHVGLMLFLIRMQLYKIAFFHLNIHAIFKSLIFICFGFTMLTSFHRQDKRLVSYINLSPIIKIIYYYACFCLIGLPFLRGFFSKDFIIEKAIEINFEMIDIVCLLFFLRVRIYYSIKLIRLYQPIYTIVIREYQLTGLMGLLIMMSLRVIIVNVFIRIVFSVTLEVFSYKVIIYLFIFMFLLLRLLSKLNFKWGSYRKLLNAFELWALNWYRVDQFIYWTMFSILEITVVLSQVKYVILVNWWVIALIIVLF